MVLSERRRKSLQKLLDTPEPRHVNSTGYEIEVNTSKEDAMEEFSKVVWHGLGFQCVPLLNLLPPAKIVKEGDEDGTGCVRVVPGAWAPVIEEEILSFDKEKGEIRYRAQKPFPANYHRGLVKFEEVDDGVTKITWSVKYQPMTGFDLIIRFLVWFMFNLGLLSVQQSVNAKRR